MNDIRISEKVDGCLDENTLVESLEYDKLKIKDYFNELHFTFKENEIEDVKKSLQKTFVNFKINAIF